MATGKRIYRKAPRESLVLSGVVMEESVYGESDKRVVLLTREKGRITAFAHRARNPKSPLHGKTPLFLFACFTVKPSSDGLYTLENVERKEGFEALLRDYEAYVQASYYLEFISLLTRETTEGGAFVPLVYHALKALLRPDADRKLFRNITVLRALRLAGLLPYPEAEDGAVFHPLTGEFTKENEEEGGIYLGPAALRAIREIYSRKTEALYSFRLDEKGGEELLRFTEAWLSVHELDRLRSAKLLAHT